MQAYTVADSVAHAHTDLDADARSELGADARSELGADARAIGHTDACADLDVRPLLHARVSRTQSRAQRTNVAGSLTHACTHTHTLADTLCTRARPIRCAARILHGIGAVCSGTRRHVYGAGTGVARRVVGA